MLTIILNNKKEKDCTLETLGSFRKVESKLKTRFSN